MSCVVSGCGMGRARSLTVGLLVGLAAIHTRHRKRPQNGQVSSHHGVFWRSTSLPSSSRARACSCHQRQPIWDLLPWWTCTSPVGNDTTISSTTSHWLITFCCGVDVVVLCRPPHEAAAMVGKLAWRRLCLLDAPLQLLARVHACAAAGNRGMVSPSTTSTRRCDALQRIR